MAMSKRTLPFGYQMIQGKIVYCEKEAKLVHDIFHLYLSGTSVTAITPLLKATGIPYREGSDWNKNMVCRILDTPNYMGQGEFPAIISLDLFNQVACKRKETSSGALNPILKGIRNTLCCASCGHKLNRDLHRSRNNMVWHCQKCGMETAPISDRELVDRVVQAINHLIVSPPPLSNPAQKTLSLETRRLDDEIQRKILDPTVSSDYLWQLVCKRAQSQYQASTSIAWSREKIRQTLSQQHPSLQLNTSLFHSAIEKVLVNSDCQITLELTDQTIY